MRRWDPPPSREASRACRLRSSPPLAAASGGGRRHPAPVRAARRQVPAGCARRDDRHAGGRRRWPRWRYQAAPVPGRWRQGVRRAGAASPDPRPGRVPCIPPSPPAPARAGPGRQRRLCGRRSASAAVEASAGLRCRSAVPVRWCRSAAPVSGTDRAPALCGRTGFSPNLPQIRLALGRLTQRAPNRRSLVAAGCLCRRGWRGRSRLTTRRRGRTASDQCAVRAVIML